MTQHPTQSHTESRANRSKAKMKLKFRGLFSRFSFKAFIEWKSLYRNRFHVARKIVYTHHFDVPLIHRTREMFASLDVFLTTMKNGFFLFGCVFILKMLKCEFLFFFFLRRLSFVDVRNTLS